MVGEYATGVWCFVCQPVEKHFDKLIARYPSTAFIALAYHGVWNLPVSNPDDFMWERLDSWYGGSTLAKKFENPLFTTHGEPWIDGTSVGHAAGAGSSTDPAIRAIDAELKKAPEAVLHVQAIPRGGSVVMTVRIDSLTPPHSDVYVRMLVVEDTVVLREKEGTPDSLTPRLRHYMVVRAVAGEGKYALGIPHHGTGTVSAALDLASPQKDRLLYRDVVLGRKPMSAIRSNGARASQFHSWSRDTTYAAYVKIVKNTAEELDDQLKGLEDIHNWKVDPTRLYAVAFVQDAQTGEVLQAQMLHVNTGPQGKLLQLP